MNDLSEKLLSILCHQKNYFFIVYIYKIYLISAEWYRNPKVDAKIVRKLVEFG